MGKNILSEELYNLKLSKKECNDFIKFTINSVVIFDVAKHIMQQIEIVKPYLKEWQNLEKSVSKILKKI